MNNNKIYLVGVGSILAHATTSWIASQNPNLRERIPMGNPPLELGSVFGGQFLVLHVGEKLKANRKVTETIAVTITVLPFMAASNNLALLAIEHAKNYNWKDCPILYSG